MKRTLIAIVALLAVAAAWFLAAPLFIDETVDEQFDLLLPSGQLDMQGIMAMAPDKRMAMKPAIMAAAAAAADSQSMETLSANGPRLLARGEFVDADAVHRGSGNALLYELPDGQHMVRFENFRTTNGPALVVYLAKHPMPATADDVSEPGYLSLGKLKGNVGNQNYPVPPGTTISDYQSVVIWCELFGVLFSPAALSPASAAAD
ncbi:MAG: DM13 domain-containing protein [Woeseia sp.]